MTGDQGQKRAEAARAIGIEQFDFSTLVGHKVVVFTEQFPGKALESKVVVANGHVITVDRSGGSGLVDGLVGEQQVVVQVGYKGEPVSIKGQLRRTEGGTCRINLGDTVTPLTRRRYRRVPISRMVRLAVLPIATFSRDSLSRLRWVETETVNLSGGGTMISFTGPMDPESTYLFLNVACTEVEFPSLLLGQVRHSLAVATGRWHVGIEFIPREERRKHVPFATIRQMPTAVFAYDETMRAHIDDKLTAWMRDNNY